jgi:arylesterase/paraoxonase
MSRLRRSRRGLAIMAVMGVLFFVGRILWANGVFSAVPTGFAGSCKLAATVPGVEDIEIVNGMVFVAVGSERGPDPRDGIYLFSDDGRLRKLTGGPKDFHPRGIGSYRSPDGSGIFLLVVNRNSAQPVRTGTLINNRFSIDTFEVSNPTTAPALVAQGTIEGGLLNDPKDVAAAGPGAFYVSNGTAKDGLSAALTSWGILPGSDILYFNGMSFRVVADDVYDARGILLTPDGNHLLVASLTARSLKSFGREVFSGNLTEEDGVTLPAAPEKIVLDANGSVWVAAHANLSRWRNFAKDARTPAPSEILRTNLLSGAPQPAQQVYGNAGSQIAAASVAAGIGRRLLIGSSLDNKLLDCLAP